MFLHLKIDIKNYYENLPQCWEICTLNDLATYKKGPFGSSLTKGMFVPETTPNRIKVYEQKMQSNIMLTLETIIFLKKNIKKC